MTRAVVAVVAAAACFWGCGSSTPTLSSAEKQRVASVELSFTTTALNGSEYRQTLDGVDYIVSLARSKPEAMVDDRTVKQVAADAADTLRPYQPDLAGRLAGAAKGR